MKVSIIALLIVVMFLVGGCGKNKTGEFINAYVQEQTFQLRLDRICKEKPHEYPTIHQQTFNGIEDYVYIEGECWKQIIYDNELTEWARDYNRGHGKGPREGKEFLDQRQMYIDTRSDDYLFSDEWERPKCTF